MSTPRLINALTYDPLIRRNGTRAYARVRLWGNGLVGAELDVTADAGDLVLTLDEGWSPHVQATVTAALPAPAILALIDPRGRDVMAHIDYGYLRADNPGVFDAEWVELWVNAVSLDVVAGTITLDLQGQELMFADAVSVAEDRPYLPTAATIDVMRDMMTWAGAIGPLVDLTDGVVSRAPIGAQLVVERGRSYWPILADLADRLGLWLYAPGQNTVMHLATRPDGLTGPVTHELRTGAGGTITGLSSELTRQAWASTVIVRHRWRQADGTDAAVYGWSRNPRPMTYQRTLVYDRETPATIDSANASAAAVLARMGTRGRRWTVEAIAAYWLRAGDVVTVEGERAVVSRVTFRPLAGSMTVLTRGPGDDA